MLICFSHLRWNLVFQRPHHLMTRWARTAPVVYWEEPVWDAAALLPSLQLQHVDGNVTVATPVLPNGLDDAGTVRCVRELLDDLLAERPGPFVRWYYTPMMLAYSAHLSAVCTVYDCMDELANFRFAPPDLAQREQDLLRTADVVFAGGWSLFEAKRSLHANIHALPSSVDVAHFSRARLRQADPQDQAALPRPRLGFYGVIDERLDLALLAAVADSRPSWQFVMIGPIAKIAPDELPQRANIAWLGAKCYDDLPNYVGGWDVAIMPFAVNRSTQFISPTKTPEFLAAGLPVVTTPIADVARQYGGLDAVHLAQDAASFVSSCERALAQRRTSSLAWRDEVDAALHGLSWDGVFARMRTRIDAATSRRAARRVIPAKPRRRHYDVLIVGAGFAGSVMAERLAADGGKRVLVVDRRPHVAGNAFDHHDAAGILVHRYGPHIFHTNSAEVFTYLSRFTSWRQYEHRVLARVGDKLVPMPINRTTLNALYDLTLTSDGQAAAYLAQRAEPVETIRTAADVVISAVGRELYETFFRGYTRKQWGRDPSLLDKSVTARVPTRTNTDDRYFTDQFQAMPSAGYTCMFKAMLDHPNIETLLGVDFADIRRSISFDRLVFTGAIDEYFDHCYGKLPYRSLDFVHETRDVPQFQGVGVVNYPSEATPYTRITEYKHLTGQVALRTSITYEYPSAIGDPYYPIPCPENQALFKRYETLALASPEVTFVGRLATYRYYNMDQVVGQALAAYRRMTQQTAACTTVVAAK